MEEQNIREAKRARNFIWTAAENYELEPLYLAFSPDGRADMYLNMTIGLTYKWFDQEKIDTFFNMLAGKEQELYEGLLWIGLENALYQKEKNLRSALTELRREYAQENLNRYRKNKEYSRIEQIRNGHCREILGMDAGLNEEDAKILHAFSFTEEMTTEQILKRTEEIFWAYFTYKPALVSKKEGTYFLQKVVGAFHSVGKVSATYVRAKNYEDANVDVEGKAGTMEKAKHYLVQFTFHGDAEDAGRYVESCFGKSIYTERQQEQVEKILCVGNHKNSHLLFTKGKMAAVSVREDSWKSRRENREIVEFQMDSEKQYEKNKKYFEENSVVYRNSIRRLTEKLKICLETQDETFPTMATHGKICPSKVWKAIYLDNPRVFEKKEEVEIPGFSVDIMIDASSSRKPMQEKIAAQAYILARSLEMCQIPAQIYSYCSIRGYTVMRIFKSYEENQKEDEIFRYVAAGNNRDGLAFRAAGHLAEKSEKSKKILLVLTDASPQDDQDAGEGAFYKNNEYTDLVAIQDTTKEVQALRRKGMQVIGIFMGSERGGAVAGKIFGHDLVKIQNISEFSYAVGCILQRVIENRV